MQDRFILLYLYFSIYSSLSMLRARELRETLNIEDITTAERIITPPKIAILDGFSPIARYTHTGFSAGSIIDMRELWIAVMRFIA